MSRLLHESIRRARVTGVVDATRLKVELDLGFGVSFVLDTDLLLLEPWAPTLADNRGAAAWTFDWLEWHMDHGGDWPFLVEIDESDQCWNRYWSVVTCAACHKVLNTELVRAGRAVPARPLARYRHPSVW